MELRNRMEASLGVTFSATMLFSYPTIERLVAPLAERMEVALDEPDAPADEAALAAEDTDLVADILAQASALDELGRASDAAGVQP
jgi:hypothetical protein